MSESAAIPGSRMPTVPDWLIPPPGGFTAEDLDRIPDLPPHTELIDGSLVFVSPQNRFHALTVSLLEQELRRTVPSHLRVRREMTTTLDRRQRPEPDVLVVQAEADQDPMLTDYPGASVVLAVEVISPDSQIRDRERKPQLYAAAGIAHFWLVENVDDHPTVYVHELDPGTGTYLPTGIHHGHLTLSVPYEIEIDLTAIDSL